MGSSILVKDETLLSEYIQQLKAYFESRRKAFTFPLDLRGTPFQIQVWKALLDIPYGTTKSYSEIAKAINRPLAVRAVGAANAANPIPVVIPCHRVIGKNGTLTGYRGGLDLKAELLRLEGIT
ncbi:methylated-DNA--[protein]-cysteine S-methyltransferase [Polycladomyces sp. WAk]|uniref:Methylated-DNA--protein-cysteine methyltransferase n=2 Tax=Polycladomyces zharkentensis TaxID=2807616 RepID=A0ABS2WGB5_9BACL|nr:methylated-DNA--[protein]-cysteine S-methyltransferase [Polycladomyces sp. WAk]